MAMSTGQLVFYSGVGLLGLTVVVLVIFLLKKPRYMPEGGIVGAPDGRKTQKLRSGYPTDALTIRRGGSRQPPAPQTDISPAGTVLLPEEADTSPQEIPPQQSTLLLSEETVPLSGGTVKLSDGTEVLGTNER